MESLLPAQMPRTRGPVQGDGFSYNFGMNPYASFLGDRDPMEVLAASPRLYRELADRLGPSGMARSPAPGKWPLSSIFAHLADAELAFGFRMRQVVAEDHHVTQPWDQERWAATYDKMSGTQALDTFAVARAWNLAWLHTLPVETFSRSFVHPERGPMTLQTLVETMAGHDLNHLGQMEVIAAQP
jgi:uncharacterized damage-inducible protein DinB